MPCFAEKLDDYFIRYLAYFNYQDYVNRLKLQKDERVLEVGCSGGNLSRFLAQKLSLGKLVCIDNLDHWIIKAKRRLRNFKNIEFLRKNILDYNLKNYFDRIVVHYILHDLTEKQKAIDVLNKNLKPEGIINIREPTRKNHGMTPKEIEDLMSLNGLKKLSAQEGYSVPIRGKVYEGVFIKVPK